jgi:hypothetical protein
LLGKSYMIVAMNPTLARAAAAAESGKGRWRPGSGLAESLVELPQRLTSLSIGDPHDSAWPEALATLPRLSQYLGNMLGAGGDDAAGESGLLTLLGVPAPGAFRVKIDPARLPRASQVRALLFPSVLATAVDDHGLRFISAESLPFACVGSPDAFKAAAKPKISVNLNSILERVRN